jgi:hypothetical protein
MIDGLDNATYARYIEETVEIAQVAEPVSVDFKKPVQLFKLTGLSYTRLPPLNMSD